MLQKVLRETLELRGMLGQVSLDEQLGSCSLPEGSCALGLLLL